MALDGGLADAQSRFAAFLEQCSAGDGDLEAACQDYPQHAPRFRRWWAALQAAGATPGSTSSETWLGLPGAGQDFGAYRIERLLGQGGMGIVYLAAHRELGRQVGLKVLRPENLFASVAKDRFWREAKVVSQLDHPNICPVFEVGEVQGIPFMAMRYLDGRTLAEHLRAQSTAREVPPGQPPSGTCTPPSTRRELHSILELFEKVARALHYAHGRGVVHRDIKPSNIMVCPDGEPVVLDFGLARQFDDDEGGMTHTGDLLGTPLYMSPEMIAPAGAPPDHRSDVYSLGVTLYECLTARRAFGGASLREIQDSILNSDPTPLRKVDRLFSRDLQVVVGKAIEKDPRGRYHTAREFADDLGRVRRLEPIQAVPPGPTLRVRRWIQRNPRAAAFGCLLALAVVAVSVLAWWIDAARKDAEVARAGLAVEASKFRAVNRFIVDGVLRAGDPDVSLGRTLTVAQALQIAAAEADRYQFEHPAVEAGVREALCEAFLGAGEFAAAAVQARRLVQLRAADLPPKDQSSGYARYLLVWSLSQSGGAREAEPLARQHLQTELRQYGPDSVAALRARAMLAGIEVKLGNRLGAESLAQQALAVFQRVPPTTENVDAAHDLARILTQLGRPSAAADLLRAVLRLRVARYGESHPRVATALTALGSALRDSGNIREARELLQRSLEMRGRFLGPDHVSIGVTLHELGLVAMATKGGRDEAERKFRRALAIFRAALGRHPSTARTLAMLGYVLRVKRDYTAAQACYLEALELERNALGPGHPDVAATLTSLGTLHVYTNEFEKAEARHREALSIRRGKLGPEHAETQMSVHNLGYVLLARGDLPGLRTLLADCVKTYDPLHPVVGRLRVKIGRLLERRKQLDLASTEARAGVDILRNRLPETHQHVVLAVDVLLRLLERTQHWADAKELLRQCLTRCRDQAGPAHPRTKALAARLDAIESKSSKAAHSGK